MYEHLRNDFLSQLMLRYDIDEVNCIGEILDKVVLDYDITEKCTALIVLENEFPKLVKLYLASKSLEGVSNNTVDLYFNRLKIFFNTVGYKHPKEISTNEIRMFLAQYQLQNGVSDRTLDKFRQVLNGFFEWCLNEEYITKNPCKNIKEIKFEVEPRRSLTRFQLEQVRRLCKTKRDLAIVDTLYSTGCRVTELVNIKFSDINQVDNSISIVGKGKKHNTVYLNDTALISLQDYVQSERKGNSEYVFVSYYSPFNQISTRTVEQFFKNMNVDFKLTPHIIRHTSATLALQSGMPITQVQKMLGHSNVNTTQIYAETLQEEVALAHKRYVI